MQIGMPQVLKLSSKTLSSGILLLPTLFLVTTTKILPPPPTFPQTHTHTHTHTLLGHSDSKFFLSQVLSRAQLATNLQSGCQSQKSWHTCITDLQRVAELNKKLSAIANCTATFLQCQLLLGKVSSLLYLISMQIWEVTKEWTSAHCNVITLTNIHDLQIIENLLNRVNMCGTLCRLVRCYLKMCC